jgi:hypothetical protein
MLFQIYFSQTRVVREVIATAVTVVAAALVGCLILWARQ